MPCWRFWAGSSSSPAFEHFACGNSAYYQSIPGHPQNGANLVVDGVVQNGSGYVYWGPPHADRGIESVQNSNIRRGESSGSCSACESLPGYDCINGQCVVQTTYGTPGMYASLAQCQSSCGQSGGCPSGEVCVSQACLDALKEKLLSIQNQLA